ncbi:hypothetical protein GJ744_010368 [Endocarpon pusillum]|uniref:Uncharacterized protein n=1 Tax=Endocarpon pusillum TaxID=364733 RepID=A0A8H7AIE6_9EURO|nr:hypothetical protein GJ744_010368 [Endocarpon pusillum]
MATSSSHCLTHRLLSRNFCTKSLRFACYLLVNLSCNFAVPYVIVTQLLVKNITCMSTALQQVLWATASSHMTPLYLLLPNSFQSFVEGTYLYGSIKDHFIAQLSAVSCCGPHWCHPNSVISGCSEFHRMIIRKRG